VRILQISSARTLGGGERHFADLSNALAARGHEIYAAIAPSTPLRQELHAVALSNIITLPLRNALDLPSAIRLARLAREKRIDILHTHMARDYPLAALAHALAPRSHLVVTRHVLFPLGRLTSMAIGSAARLIAVSEVVARTLRARRILPAHKIVVIPNGINFERFDTATRNLSRDDRRQTLSPSATFLVGTVGELSAVKGQDNFIRAAAIVVARSPHAVEFVIVGEDASRTGDTRAQLQRLIAEHNLHGRVHLTGHRDDVPEILASLDLFVSASRSEAFGLAIVEAMACDVPVVATATEGACEIIEDGTTGKLVPVNDVETLAVAILSLLENSHERGRMSTAARARVRERFSLTQMVEATEEVYNACLETL
jgi:glycosyltransferase involved in cell wall biosynthesis